MKSGLHGMDIYYDVHASNRSLERSIDENEVKCIIDDPTTKCQVQKNGRVKFKNSGVIIIAELRKKCLWVKTVYRTNRKEKQ